MFCCRGCRLSVVLKVKPFHREYYFTVASPLLSYRSAYWLFACSMWAVKEAEIYTKKHLSIRNFFFICFTFDFNECLFFLLMEKVAAQILRDFGAFMGWAQAWLIIFNKSSFSNVLHSYDAICVIYTIDTECSTIRSFFTEFFVRNNFNLLHFNFFECGIYNRNH